MRPGAFVDAFKKALLVGAFLLSGAQGAVAGCALAGGGEQVRVRHVFDGDTLQLEDGRRVRLIGINTPELGRDGRPDQPYAEEARRALRQLAEGRQLQLVAGQAREDRYGRVLAHLYDNSGSNLEELLLARGLGDQISVPPNLALRECLRAAEQRARAAGLGIWKRRPVIDVAEAKQLSGGFQYLSGRVTRVDRTRQGWFLELEARLVLHIPTANLEYFSGENFNGWHGRELGVRGWLAYRQLSSRQLEKGFRPWVMKVLHPDALD